MRVVVQRVLAARCEVEGKVTGSISKGYMLLVGFTHSDSSVNIEKMANKIFKLRIFEDEFGKMNKSIDDIGGEILSISQFTLYANPNSGNRPSFIDAMAPELATKLYNEFNEYLRWLGLRVETGIFGADMKLFPECDGPVTINLEF